ncbi:MAG: GDYXXLXY domain-containing protein [Endomicrobium sp.]|jgi:uncharacterized membrane-anchored protein|nr:GDYXXLXY domain-containing protein [Endomicrobium sp.]
MNSKKMFFALMALWFILTALFVIYKESNQGESHLALLRVTPVDFSELYNKDGNLVLTYDIGKINSSQTLSGSKLPADGDIVFVSLVPNGRFVIGSDIYRSRPQEGLFIQGKLKISKRLLGFRDSDISIIYGIETIKIPEEVKETVGRKIEKGLASVEVKINSDGLAKIENFYIDGQETDFSLPN